MFADRQDAGRQLAAALLRFKDEKPSVLALPRGGVPVAFEIATALNAPLDLVLVRKIGAPDQPELAVGAIADGQQPEFVVNEDVVALLDLPEEYLQQEYVRQLQEIERRRQAYLGARSRLNVTGRTVLIVDDGIATGSTVRAVVFATRRAQPKRIVLAVPVAPVDTIEILRQEVDEVVCLETHERFYAIGFYYRDFTQVSDQEVRDLLARAPKPPPSEPVSAAQAPLDDRAV